jgi:NAD-dependent DNA ligase
VRSDTKNVRNGLRRRDAAVADLEGAAVLGDYAELLNIPRLGLVRAESLAASGIRTLADLHKTSESDLARVKWVGAGNARLIKQWLAAQSQRATIESADTDSAPTPSSQLVSDDDRDQVPISELADIAADSGSDGVAPGTKKGRRKRSAGRKAASSKATKPDAVPTTGLKQQSTAQFDVATVDHDSPGDELPTLAVSEALQEDLGQIDTAISRLKEAIPKKSRDKKLGRQLDKVANSVSDVPDNFEVLQNKEKIAATRALDRIAKLLSEAVESGKLSAKKQEAMGVELKKFRKRLVKALGGQ